MEWFLGVARRERQYPLDEGTPPVEALAHLNLLDTGQPSHAAVLLFGSQPQRFLAGSEVKCLHFHGTEVRKPIPSYQAYKGTLFDLVDQAVDFVMSKITRSVGTRAKSAQAPVEYELPRETVAEAIVNAVAHRDYTSNASAQVMLFADRLEVWNPGELPSALTLAQLRVPHPSIPRNPLVSEPLFLARYIERAGTGTLDMIARCVEAGLPEPEFRQDGAQFVMTLWRDWLTEKAVAALGLNERQKQALVYVRKNGRITNRECQALTGVTDRTALRDLDELVAKGVLQKRGTTGRSIHYVLRRQTRQKPDKPDTRAADVESRRKPDKADRAHDGAARKKRAVARSRKRSSDSAAARPALRTRHGRSRKSTGKGRR